MTVKELGVSFTEKLGLTNLPIGMLYSENVPENATAFKSKGNGCILPLIYNGFYGGFPRQVSAN
jgi:hypothetical protein